MSEHKLELGHASQSRDTSRMRVVVMMMKKLGNGLNYDVVEFIHWVLVVQVVLNIINFRICHNRVWSWGKLA